MTFILVALGLLPFAFGGFMNWYMITYPNSPIPYKLIGIVVLLIWAVIAFAIKPYIKNTKKIIIGLNVVAFVVLVLLGIQELILNAYWFNFVGVWTQLYYLPLLNISFALTNWIHHVFSTYCAAFLLMVIATFAGSKLRIIK